MLDFQQCAERYHASGGVAHLEFRDVLNAVAEIGFGLHPHLISQSELVVIIDERRAQVGLQSVEDQAER